MSINKEYPKEFYFSSIQPNTIWSESPKQDPAWQLDINKSIRMSKLYWKSEARTAATIKKKKIILSDARIGLTKEKSLNSSNRKIIQAKKVRRT